LVLKEGKLVEQGTHTTLSNNTESYYYTFWKTNN
jgi:ABC-type multidrug transport system fused ATPase/permease subunit